MFVDTEVEKKRAKSRGDGDDYDDIKRVQILIKKWQLSPVNYIVNTCNRARFKLNLHTKVTEDHDDEEDSYVMTSYQEGGVFSYSASLSCVPKVNESEERRNTAS